MENLLLQIGEFLAVDIDDIKIKYFDTEKSALKIITQSGGEILLNLVSLK